MTLGSLFAIFEPWIWRRLGPVPACLAIMAALTSQSKNKLIVEMSRKKTTRMTNEQTNGGPEVTNRTSAVHGQPSTY